MSGIIVPHFLDRIMYGPTELMKSGLYLSATSVGSRLGTSTSPPIDGVPGTRVNGRDSDIRGPDPFPFSHRSILFSLPLPVKLRPLSSVPSTDGIIGVSPSSLSPKSPSQSLSKLLPHTLPPVLEEWSLLLKCTVLSVYSYLSVLVFFGTRRSIFLVPSNHPVPKSLIP